MKPQQIKKNMKKVTTFLSIFIFLAVLGPLSIEAGAQSGGDKSFKRKTDNSNQFTTRTALVIGNSKYDSRPLRNPVNDARAIAAQLKKNGFEVTLETDTTKRQMVRAIKRFGKELRAGGAGLFYYSGHGIQIGGRNYLLPVDVAIESESDVEHEAVAASRVLGKMEDASNGLNIVILDACRDNPFKKSFSRSAAANNGLARMDAPTGSFIAYATKPGSVASDGNTNHSPYTSALLKFMVQPNLTIEQLFKEVRKSVIQETNKKQTPWESSSLVGSFSFAGNAAPLKAVVSTPSPTTSNPSYSINAEELLWKTASESGTRSDYEYFLQEYPSSPFASVAHLKIRQLNVDVEKSTLTIQTKPSSAVIKLLNTKPAYTPGMKLKPGRYEIEVSADGYELKKQWVAIPASENVEVSITLQSLGPKAGDTYTDPTTGIEFVYIPGGCFQMGSPSSSNVANREEDEGPVHEVCVDGFFMGKYEVTNEQYRRYQSSHNSKDYWGNNLNGKNQPAVYVGWDDAGSFGSWLTTNTGKTFRLPTEAEWEYAARAGSITPRYWGDDPDAACSYGNVRDRTTSRVNEDFTWENHNCDDGYAVPAPVGSFKPNNFGLHDMLGNVTEWTQDWYGENYYSSSPRKNPHGPSSGDSRVIRGGSWRSTPGYVRSEVRLKKRPDFRHDYLGFRLVFHASVPGQ